MKTIINYKRGNGEETGAIMVNDHGNDKYTYIAVTAASSRAYGSMKGAEKYMSKFDYVKS